MTVELSAELEDVLERNVSSGRFRSREEALAHAIRQLDVSITGAETPKGGRAAAVERVIEERKRMRWDPGVTIRDLIEDGRRR